MAAARNFKRCILFLMEYYVFKKGSFVRVYLRIQILSYNASLIRLCTGFDFKSLTMYLTAL